MTELATPWHKNPWLRGPEIYKFLKSIWQHHSRRTSVPMGPEIYYFHIYYYRPCSSLLKNLFYLCPCVKKRFFIKKYNAFCTIWPIWPWPDTRTPCQGVMKFTNFGSHYSNEINLSIQCQEATFQAMVPNLQIYSYLLYLSFLSAWVYSNDELGEGLWKL